MKELYKFFKFNGKVVDIEDFNHNNLEIYSRQVLKMIAKGNRVGKKCFQKELQKS
jgi:hypothetical protein